MPINPELLKAIEEQKIKRRKIDFFILVWGSGSSDPLAHKKRLKMMDILKPEFGDGNVLMSEDAELKDLAAKYGDIVAESIEVDVIDFVALPTFLWANFRP